MGGFSFVPIPGSGLPSLPLLPGGGINIGGGFVPIGGPISGPVNGPVTASPKNPYPNVTLPGGIGDITVGLPGGGGGLSGGVSVSNASLGSASLGFLSSPVGYLFGSSLLRLAFFILGFICIIGAIYLYRDTRFIIKAPLDAGVRAAKGAIAA